jgi:UDP-N-acetylmuramoyl-tripeptide--D-alanyl-D-alanine ligase
MSDPRPGAPLWTAKAIAAATGGALTGPDFAAQGVAIDSREIATGDLFIALAAARDGHEFVAAALAQGAAGALVSRPTPGPCVEVSDTLRGLEALAVAARDRAIGARRGAVTGSVGKTSVTQAVLAGFTLAGAGHGSIRSFNNHIGVPLTLARMPPATRRAIFEIGMNHAGEIDPLSRLVRPQAVAITTVEAVHVENFADGVAGVARAKGEILAGLEPGGVAILNADNPWFEFLAGEARARGAEVRAFGHDTGAFARLTGFAATPEGAQVDAVIEGRPLSYALRQTAPHWGPMSLAALLMMRALGLDLDLALKALADFGPLAGRGAERRAAVGAGVFTLIDESYNASPVSLTSALRALGARPVAGHRIAALTDMLELGADAGDRHRDMAPVAAEAGIDLVFCAGPLMKNLFDALEPARRGAWAPEAKGLIPKLAEAIGPGDVVMVKGSKASKASEIAEALASGLATGEDR